MALFAFIAAICTFIIGCLRVYFGLRQFSKEEKHAQISKTWYQYRPIAQGLSFSVLGITLAIICWLGTSLQGLIGDLIIGGMSIFCICFILYLNTKTTPPSQ
jgi:hypothetical protein